jgi:hypothetical protein
LRIEEGPQISWVGEQNGHKIGKSSGWIAGDREHNGEPVDTTDHVDQQIAPSGNKKASTSSVSPHRPSGPNYRSDVSASNPIQKTNKLARVVGIHDCAPLLPSPVESTILQPTSWVFHRNLGFSNQTSQVSLPTTGFSNQTLWVIQSKKTSLQATHHVLKISNNQYQGHRIVHAQYDMGTWC